MSAWGNERESGTGCGVSAGRTMGAEAAGVISSDCSDRGVSVMVGGDERSGGRGEEVLPDITMNE